MKAVKRMGAIGVLLLLVFTVLTFSGCGREKRSPVSSIDQLNGRVIGSISGSAYTPKIKKHYPGSTVMEYNADADMISALKQNRIEAYVVDEPIAIGHIEAVDGLKKLDSFISKERYGFMLNKDNTELCEKINKALAKIKSDGRFKYLEDKWVFGKEERKLEPFEKQNKSNGTLNVGITPTIDPFAYYVEGEYIGYDVELIYMIAAELGYDVKFTPYDIASVANSLTAQREDVAIGCLTYTEERAQSVLFTDSTYDSGIVAVVLSDEEKPGFLNKITESFERTFIVEERWRMVVDGLLATIELSLYTLAIGTLLGFFFSFLLRSKNRPLSRAAAMVSTVIDGLPVLIVLMVLYYIVLSKTNLSPLVIGIIGLSIDFANTVAGILNVGIASVAKGEIEAAYAMGYSKTKTFLKIVLPQTVNKAFATYTGAVISMIKATSVIGYITVVDLTRAGDIIRSRTYDAFFPLIVVALIYFIIARIFVSILHFAAKKINPKHRKRTVKGVQIND